LVIITKQCSPFPKPTLAKLVSEQLLQVLNLNASSVGNVPQDVTSRMEKYEDFKKMIQFTHCVYA
jgi:hypothetical protein